MQWSFKASGVYDAAMGRSLDNITVTNSGGWDDLGHGLVGVAGVPNLSFPAGVPAGTQLYVQCWVQDPTNPLFA